VGNLIVDTPLELWTTLIGWSWYNLLWDIMSGTGIVFLPFLGILLDVWRESFVDGADRGAATRGIRALEIEVYLALTVIVMAAVPNSLTTVSPANVQYNATATLVTPTQTNTGSNDGTFTSAFGVLNGTSANVPPWWYLVMRLTSGINQAFMTGIARGTPLVGMRLLQEQAKLIGISNPTLRSEAQRFYNECYVPARTRFFAAAPSAAATAAMAAHGNNDDTEWIGSHAFRDDLNLYASLYAAAPVTGWPFNASDPSAADVAGEPNPPAYARPDCKTWWEDPTYGLRGKLIQEANRMSVLGTQSFSDKMGIAFSALSLDADYHADVTAKTLLNNDAGAINNTTGTGFGRQVAERGRAIANTLTATIAYLLNWLAMGVIIPGLQMLQPLLLMGIYTLLPLYLILARYSLEALVIGAMGIFTVKFWTALWFAVSWLDEKLIAALYPSQDDAIGLFVLAAKQVFGASADGALAKRMILDITILALYVALPTLWTGMMAWASIRLHTFGEVKESILRQQQLAGSANLLPGARRGIRGIGSGGGGARKSSMSPSSTGE
jgi:hypothetical protein